MGRLKMQNREIKKLKRTKDGNAVGLQENAGPNLVI